MTMQDEEKSTSRLHIRGNGQFIVLVNAGSDPKTQYFTAKKVLEFWGQTNLSAVLDRFRKEENVALYRADTESQANALAHEFAAHGAKVWCVDQRRIGKFEIF